MFTATIANQAVSIYKDSLGGSDKINEQTDYTFTVIDLTGLLNFTQHMPVEIVDDSRGTRFTGFVNNQPTATVLYPNPARLWAIDAKDGTWRAQKRTTNKSYKQQYAGTILVDMIQRVGSADGLFCRAGLGWYELFTEWQNATQSGTLATTNTGSGNVGDGDLELALAGSPVTFQQVTQSDFSGISIGGLALPASGGVTFAPSSAIQFQATESVAGIGNAYTYVKIWSGSYTIAAVDKINYDVWISSTSPQQMAAIDFVCSDGSTFRDSLNNGTDAQGIGPHAKNDLAGLATNQWYTRSFFIDNGGLFTGKTISYVSVAFEGESAGQYTAYFRNISITNGATDKLDVLTKTATSIAIVPQQLQNSGYTAMSCQLVTAYERHGFLESGIHSLSAVGIARSSYVSWDITMPATNTSSFSFSITASIDAFSTFLPCSNNGAIPGLLPGMNLAGKEVRFVYVMDQTGPDPTQTPFLSRVACAVNPSYAATKSDVVSTTNGTTGWSGGTLTNLLNTSGNTLQLNGFARDWQNGNVGSQTLYGATNPKQFIVNRQFFLQSDSTADVRSRLDFAGSAWQNFTAEVDIVIPTNANNAGSGFVYRTTGWQNNNDTYGYSVQVSGTQITFGTGTNSSSGAGSFTQLATAALVLTAGSIYRLKVIVNGSSHQVFLNDVRYINQSDSTYTAAGYVGLRFYNATGATQQAVFDNFGIVASLSGTWVSPAIDIHSLSTISNSQLLLQIDPASSTTICTFLPEISLDNGATWTSCLNTLTGTTMALAFVGSGYYQVLPVPGLSPGTNVSSLTQVKLRLTISATTAATGAAMPDLTAVTLWAIGPYSSSGVWSTTPFAWDSAQRGNVVGGFGVATNGQTYTKSGTGTVALTSNELIISATTGDVAMRLGTATGTDEDATVRFSLSTSGQSAGLALRYTDANNFYRLSFTTTSATLTQMGNGEATTLQTVAVTLAANTFYWMRFRVTGSGPIDLSGRVWLDGTVEPTTWTITATN